MKYLSINKEIYIQKCIIVRTDEHTCCFSLNGNLIRNGHPAFPQCPKLKNDHAAGVHTPKCFKLFVFLSHLAL